MPRGASVLATAALHAHAVAAVSLSVSPNGPFDQPFDDFHVFDHYDDRNEPSEFPDGGGAQRRWAPPPRDGEFPFRGPHEGARWENRMLIVPQQKVAFCYIEKNACTQFNRLVNAWNGISHGRDAIPFWKSNSEGIFKPWFRDGLDPISKANGWKMAIFLRDPAERFLSAWLSKCDDWEYGGIDCLGPQVTQLPEREKVEMFEKTVLELLPQYMATVRANGTFNAHYDPQHIFCGGRPLEEYDFVGDLSGSTQHIQEQVIDMLKREAGYKESDHLMDFPRTLFPSASTAGHGTGSANLMRQFYRNSTIYNKVVEHYAEDYRWASTLFSPSPYLSRGAGVEPRNSPTPPPPPTSSRTPSSRSSRLSVLHSACGILLAVPLLLAQ